MPGEAAADDKQGQTGRRAGERDCAQKKGRVVGGLCAHRCAGAHRSGACRQDKPQTTRMRLSGPSGGRGEEEESLIQKAGRINGASL